MIIANKNTKLDGVAIPTNRMNLLTIWGNIAIPNNRIENKSHVRESLTDNFFCAMAEYTTNIKSRDAISKNNLR